MKNVPFFRVRVCATKFANRTQQRKFLARVERPVRAMSKFSLPLFAGRPAARVDVGFGSEAHDSPHRHTRQMLKKGQFTLPFFESRSGVARRHHIKVDRLDF